MNNGKQADTNGAGRSLRLSEQAEKQIERIISRYPSRKSAIMPALYIAQDELGWISDEAVSWVAERIAVSPAHVRAVATFYTMYYKKPVGRYHIQICRTLSCLLCGAKEITEFVKKQLGVGPGEVTSDGMWSWEEVECLGSCGTAPLVEINDVFFENLTIQKLEATLKQIEREQPDLRYSTVRGELGKGMAGHPLSEAWKPAGK